VAWLRPSAHYVVVADQLFWSLLSGLLLMYFYAVIEYPVLQVQVCHRKPVASFSWL
jgi:hypothetical protein